ncbi:MAG: hypothetical protein FWE85_05760, partial [Clostridiales bacterium]|nr:hypothetical protein [Clostridiales bacterium]
MQKNFRDRIQLKIDIEERNFFRDEEKKRLRLKKRARSLVLLSITLVLVFLASLFLVTDLTLYKSAPASYLQGVINVLTGFYNFIIGEGQTWGTQFI